MCTGSKQTSTHHSDLAPTGADPHDADVLSSTPPNIQAERPVQIPTTTGSDEYFILMTTYEELEASGVDMHLIDTVACPLPAHPDRNTWSPSQLILGRLRGPQPEVIENVRSQIAHLREGLSVLRHMTDEQIKLTAEQLSFRKTDRSGDENLSGP